MAEPPGGPAPPGQFCPGDPDTVQAWGLGGEEPHIRATMVTFPPAMRTYWHCHTRGQVLHVLEGRGWVQRGTEPPITVRPGDTVRIGPRQRHWHGAAATTSLRHLAVTAGETEWERECPTLPD